MKIEFLYFKNCPSYKSALSLLEKMLEEAGTAGPIEKIEIVNEELALQNRFLGSPSIRINGIDIEGCEDASEYGLKCRIYKDTGSGVPSEFNLRKALLKS
jgi:glutaredoxin